MHVAIAFCIWMSFSPRMMIMVVACNRCVECGDCPSMDDGWMSTTNSRCMSRVAAESRNGSPPDGLFGKRSGLTAQPRPARARVTHLRLVYEAIPTTSSAFDPQSLRNNHLMMPSPLPSPSCVFPVDQSHHITHSTLFHRDGDSHASAPARMIGPPPLLAHIYAGTRPSITRVPSHHALTWQGS